MHAVLIRVEYNMVIDSDHNYIYVQRLSKTA